MGMKTVRVSVGIHSLVRVSVGMEQECVGQLSGIFFIRAGRKVFLSVLGFSSSFRTGAGGEGAHRHPGVGEGTAAGRRQPGPHTRALALRITAASHDKGLVLFAVSHSKHSSRTEQKQSLEDTRSLNCLHAKINVQ